MDKLKTQIKQLPLNHKNVFMPQIGFGTYQLQKEECKASIKWAIKSGYRLIDTASCYRNEVEIKEALQEIYKEGIVTRKDLFITSKIAPTEVDQPLKAFNNIIQKLECEYLDLLLIHWPGKSKLKPSDPLHQQFRLECYQAMEQLLQQNKVRSIGVSNFKQHHLHHLLTHSQVKPAVNQFELHPFYQDKQTILFCQQNNIQIQAYSSLCLNQDILIHNQVLKSIAAEHHKTVQQVALKWALQKNYAIIPKSKTQSYIQQNIDLFDFDLDEKQIELIDNLNQDYKVCWDPSSVLY